MTNSERCRDLGIAYVPPAEPVIRARPRLIGPQGWLFLGLCAFALTFGAVLALVTP